MRALSVRQPWAELILRGIKTIEVRSIRTKIRDRVYGWHLARPERLSEHRKPKKRPQPVFFKPF